MYEYRQVLVRMRLGDSDREIARSGLMGRAKSAALRATATAQGWLVPEQPLPDNVLAARNMEYVKVDCPLADGDEVAFFPPVTGGGR